MVVLKLKRNNWKENKMQTGNIVTMGIKVRFRRNKGDPIEEITFNSSEAAYHFALNIENNGGITMVERTVQTPPVLPKLRFNDDERF